MEIINFIANYWSDILLVIAGIVAIAVAIYRKDYGFIKTQIFELVTNAEKEFGSGTGTLKLATVINQLYTKLPSYIRIFATEAQLKKAVEKILELAKEKWESNPNLLK